MRELRTFELSDRIDDVNKILENKELMKQIYSSSGLHMNQVRGGVEITISSIVGQIAEELKRQD